VFGIRNLLCLNLIKSVFLEGEDIDIIRYCLSVPSCRITVIILAYTSHFRWPWHNWLSHLWKSLLFSITSTVINEVVNDQAQQARNRSLHRSATSSEVQFLDFIFRPFSQEFEPQPPPHLQSFYNDRVHEHVMLTRRAARWCIRFGIVL